MCPRLTLLEKDVTRRESYEQQQVVHFLVQRRPSQILRVGSHGGAMMEHQLPLRTPLRSKAGSPWDPHRTRSIVECSPDWGPVQLDKETSGGHVDKQEVTAKTTDLPKLTKPVRVNFSASSLMSSPRETSHRVPMRE